MKTKPQRINAADIAGMAAQGVNRALAARDSRMRILTPEETAEVSGGAVFKLDPAVIAGGGRREDLVAATLGSKMTIPSLDASIKGMV